MNRAQKTAVSKITNPSEEYSVLQTICRQPLNESVVETSARQWGFFRKVLMDVSFSFK